jgi:uncharacterized protein (TIGR02147 family)
VALPCHWGDIRGGVAENHFTGKLGGFERSVGIWPAYVTQYTDYRAFLKDWIEERRRQGLPGSNRWFAQKMGSSATSWLSAVLSGKKGLSKATANKLSQVLKHTPLEARYFESLVSFNQARGIEQRNAYFQQLTAIRKLKDVRVVAEQEYQFFATWYHASVRALIGMYPFRDDYERLARMVSPPIRAGEARKSVGLLEKLGFIRKNDDGCWELTDTAISAGKNVRALSVDNYRQEAMRLAQEALDRYSKEEREIAALTVGISRGTFEKARRILEEARQRIAELANVDEDADRVYQLNIQMFPLSKAPGSTGEKR